MVFFIGCFFYPSIINMGEWKIHSGNYASFWAFPCHILDHFYWIILTFRTTPPIRKSILECVVPAWYCRYIISDIYGISPYSKTQIHTFSEQLSSAYSALCFDCIWHGTSAFIFYGVLLGTQELFILSYQQVKTKWLIGRGLVLQQSVDTHSVTAEVLCLFNCVFIAFGIGLVLYLLL